MLASLPDEAAVGHRLAVVEAENVELRERIAFLERELGARGFRAPLEFGLTAAEETVLGVLVARPIGTKEMLLTALYREFARDEPDQKITDVFVCKLRKKLKPFGIQIETVWGRGWLLNADMKSLVQELADEAAGGSNA